MSDEAQPMSIEEAKLRLLEWSDVADEGLMQDLQDAVESVKAGTRKVVPWAAGAAALLGFIALRGRRNGGGAGAGGVGGLGGGEDGHGVLHRGIGVLRSAIKVAMFVLPLARPFFASRRTRE